MGVGHVSDISGAVPGSLGVHNKDIFSDGLQVSILFVTRWSETSERNVTLNRYHPPKFMGVVCRMKQSSRWE